MKATVWTSWFIKQGEESKKPKCIFSGDIVFPPSVGDYITVREGFGAEHVKSLIHDFTNGSVEIHVHTTDPGNAYGDNLYQKA